MVPMRFGVLTMCYLCRSRRTCHPSVNTLTEVASPQRKHKKTSSTSTHLDQCAKSIWNGTSVDSHSLNVELWPPKRRWEANTWRIQISIARKSFWRCFAVLYLPEKFLLQRKNCRYCSLAIVNCWNSETLWAEICAVNSIAISNMIQY